MSSKDVGPRERALAAVRGSGKYLSGGFVAAAAAVGSNPSWAPLAALFAGLAYIDAGQRIADTTAAGIGRVCEGLDRIHQGFSHQQCRNLGETVEPMVLELQASGFGADADNIQGVIFHHRRAIGDATATQRAKIANVLVELARRGGIDSATAEADEAIEIFTSLKDGEILFFCALADEASSNQQRGLYDGRPVAARKQIAEACGLHTGVLDAAIYHLERFENGALIVGTNVSPSGGGPRSESVLQLHPRGLFLSGWVRAHEEEAEEALAEGRATSSS